MRFKRNTGFTILETLVATGILVALFGGVFLLFRGVARTNKQASWSLSAQQDARNGLNFLRDELQRASYKSAVSAQSVVSSTDDPAYWLHIVRTDFNRPVHVNADKTVMRWRMAKPNISIPGEPPEAGWVTEGELALKDRMLKYTTKAIEGAPPDRIFTDRVLVRDIASLTLEVAAFDQQGVRTGNLIKMWLELRHPEFTQFPNAWVKTETSARVEVQVAFDL